METTTATKMPQPTINLPDHDKTEFDPCSNAKPCSPFYLYNHDSPRPSTDHRSKPSFNMSLQDLEGGSETLTPSVSREKMENKKLPKTKLTKLREKFMPGTCQQQMCQPKAKGWLKSMPKKQRTIVKLIIALVLVGCMVGVAVGIAVGLQSNVNKANNNQQGNIVIIH